MAKLLTLANAAALLGVTPDTLRQQAQAGRLRAEKLGSIWTVTEEEVERYRRDHKGQVGPKPRPSPDRPAN